MHYEIDYSKLEGKAKDEKAIEDIISYLGKDRFQKINKELKKYLSEGATLDHFRLALSFAGVQGFPVEAWFRYVSSDREAAISMVEERHRVS